MKVLKKIRQIVLHNWALKLFSVVAAFLLWLFVMSMEDPEVDKTFYNIPVRMVNTEVLDAENMVYEVLDKTDYVRSVTVSAPKSVRDELESGDIVAEADFSKLTVTNTVEITFYSQRYGDKISSISGSSNILRLNIEEKKVKRLALTVSTTGEVEQGYIINNVTPDQNRIEISGPESVISQVASASVYVDVSDSSESISTYADIVLYNSAGKVIEPANAKLNVDSVLVKVEILKVKEVTIGCYFSGTPAAGYLSTGETACSPTTVKIAGVANVVDPMNRFIIPAEAVNVTGQTEDLMVNVNLADYLPGGIVLADPEFSGRVAVTVYIEPETVQTVMVPVSRIAINNVPTGFTVEFTKPDGLGSLVISGLAEDAAAIDPLNLRGSINMDDFFAENGVGSTQDGEYTVPVEIILNDKLKVVTPMELSVTITKVEE